MSSRFICNLNLSMRLHGFRKLPILLLLFLFANNCIQAQNADINLLKRINANQKPLSTSIFKFTSNSAYFIPFAYPAISFTVGKFNKDNPLVRESFFSAVSLTAASLMSYSIKIATKRPRPYDKYPNVLTIEKPSKTYSFPSGHTTVAFCTATSMTLYYQKWYVAVPAYAWACSVAYSRMYLGKHYPSDLIGGIILGAGIPLLFHFVKPVNGFIDKMGKGLLHY